jgi:glutathione S-transferase
MITISAFRWVPDFAQGQVRDLRARWALEEAGLPYKARLLGQGDQDKPEYRALQPFGQVPILEEDGFALFESGAIVLYIGERSEALLPKDPAARARATQWLIAALNSIEPFIMDVARIDLFYKDQEWAKLRRPGAVEFAQRRLAGSTSGMADAACMLRPATSVLALRRLNDSRVPRTSASAPACRRDSRRSRAGSCGRAIRLRRISPAAGRAGTWNRPGPRTAPASPRDRYPSR